MNLILAAFKKKAAACAIIFALLGFRPSARAQTPAATNALQFSNGGQVTLTFPGPDLPPPWTAEMWVLRSDAVGSSAVLFNSPAFGLKLEQFGAPNRNVGITIYGTGDLPFNYTVPTNVWTHLAFTCDGNNTMLYVNGVLADSREISISMPLTRFGSLTTDLLNATVDEVSVWNRARSGGEIKSTFQFPTAAPQSGLVLLWHMDEPSGPKVPDSSGNHNNATVATASHVPSTAPIISQNLVVNPQRGSIEEAVRTANRIGNMVINFSPNSAGMYLKPDFELNITNDLTMDGSSLSSPVSVVGEFHRHFVISPGVNVTISGINLTEGLAQASYPAASLGGSISNAGNLTLNNVVFAHNQSIGPDATSLGPGANAEGGAIYNLGTLTLNQCTFSNNIVRGGAGSSGSTTNSANGGAAHGAAIYNVGSLAANLSSFYGQSTFGGPAVQASGPSDLSISGHAVGGAIFNSHAGVAVLNECTLAGNLLQVQGPASILGDALGGAIYSAGTLAVNQSTLASNSFQGPVGFRPEGGSIFNAIGMIIGHSPTNVSIFNSILGPDDVPQHLNDYIRAGRNLIDATNILLAPLDNYGGRTLTMPLMAGSPGIDGGDDSAVNLFPTDQRGFPRQFGAHVDVGAVESAPPSLPAGMSNAMTAVIISTNTPSGTYTVQFNAQYLPNGGPSTVTFQYGPLSYNGSNSVNVPGYLTFTNGSVNVDFGRNYLFHWNVVLANVMGSIVLPDNILFLPPFPTDVAGDLDGDGVVSQDELNQVYSHYLATSPYLLITNTVGLGQSNVNFAVADGLAATYIVQVSTNLNNWTNLGPAWPMYNFTDTNAPLAPQRYYRLVYPR